MLPPIVRSVSVPWDQAAAFERFTARFGEWWPSHTHSIGEKRIARVVFEMRIDGRIFEKHKDDRRFQWGQITSWDPPRSVGFTWHPSRDPSTAQDVTVEFLAQGAGTEVRLTSSGWERWGKGAKGAQRMYSAGWNYMLHVWAGRRTLSMRTMDGMMIVARIVQFLRGGLDASIARAGGEITGRETSA